jgi:anhydro-N-acetylmuramic acid kinase
MKNKFKVIGLMSGTSMDGLDIAYCHFLNTSKGWQYELKKATTIKYSPAWIKRLSTAHHLTAERLVALDVAYGKFLGEACKKFIVENSVDADFIASHGHTVFHNPKDGYTFQLGNGNGLHAVADLPVIYDFRSLDVMLGGEGAPLVPAGDKFLFGDYDICLNLGGIANLSMDVNGKRIAYDVCFCNMSLNYLMQQVGKQFDKQGERASTGEISTTMLKQLAKVYNVLRTKRPSIGREIFEEKIKPILDQKGIRLEDKLRTCIESTAREIADVMAIKKKPIVLCTGGGVFNSFLMSCLLDHCNDNATLIIPDETVVKFKEALVFGFLGVLRLKNKANCLQSVTGAVQNSSSGIMVGFKR